MQQNLKNAACVVTSQFAKKDYLANLKSEIDKLGIDKLEKAPSGVHNMKSNIDELNIGKLKTTRISKLSNVVKNVLKCCLKTEYDELVKKFK